MARDVQIEVVEAMATIYGFCNTQDMCENCPLYDVEKFERGCHLFERKPFEWKFKITTIRKGEVGESE